MKERMFLEATDVSVSNSRFIVSGQTYEMSNVTSVKTDVEEAKKGAGIIIALVGLCVLFGVPSILWGIIIIMAGIFSFIGAKNKYSVVLSTSLGENKALTSEDETQIKKIVSALNDSIVSRGQG